jgi:hypothetical protein
MVKMVKADESVTLQADEVVEIAGTGISVRLVGVTSAHAVNGNLFDLATFLIIGKGEKDREVTLEIVNGKSTSAETGPYILSLESANGYRGTCSIRIMKKPGPEAASLETGAKKIRVQEGESGSVFGITVRILDFVEAFVMGEDGIHSSHPDFTLELSLGAETRTERHCLYGTAIEFGGIRLTVTDCATGTRDFKSFADLKAVLISGGH